MPSVASCLGACFAARCQVWGTHSPRVAASYHAPSKLQRLHDYCLRTLCDLLPSTPRKMLLAELGLLPLQVVWWRQTLQFWNSLAALPVGSFYHTVSLDNLADAFGGGACSTASSLARCLHLVGYNMPRVCDVIPISDNVGVLRARHDTMMRLLIREVTKGKHGSQYMIADVGTLDKLKDIGVHSKRVPGFILPDPRVQLQHNSLLLDVYKDPLTCKTKFRNARSKMRPKVMILTIIEAEQKMYLPMQMIQGYYQLCRPRFHSKAGRYCRRAFRWMMLRQPRQVSVSSKPHAVSQVRYLREWRESAA